ncbi:type III pantothenate kinase [Candidatus Thiothrix sp. Deng01]|uniref:Type III pantothenate kinase n=1 Tax=Candidatus Thiothrix phosphatis TaxID=3112415 RepID=A0ABU6D0M0_9GAMM|nr:type III pantothenate kinase [Candidatus Thiothrix sp. Deng01]MEB4592606.1 type III pantothenate kinase [Candidatus Thiothrix sp. Deng01]
MVLLVDAGNSRLKWSELDAAGSLSAQQARAYGERPALAAFIDLLDAYPAVGHIILVHVLTQLFADSVREVCALRGVNLRMVHSVPQAYGIISGYQNPTSLGADRFVGLVAARRLAGDQPCIVIDCGTAITVDAVEGDGRHLGGLILPGLQLSAEALIARAQGRLSLSFEQPGIFADGTARAIGSGCLFGLVGAIEGICTRMQLAMSAPPLRILTGGDAAHLRSWLHDGFLVQPDLLMHGLRYIAEQEACTSC